jgi:hypothetical protein
MLLLPTMALPWGHLCAGKLACLTPTRREPEMDGCFVKMKECKQARREHGEKGAFFNDP